MYEGVGTSLRRFLQFPSLGEVPLAAMAGKTVSSSHNPKGTQSEEPGYAPDSETLRVADPWKLDAAILDHSR